ncbi:MAG: hypothetical protein GY946_14490 [bacterium]|nr:hypothetical protein [bacterium]
MAPPSGTTVDITKMSPSGTGSGSSLRHGWISNPGLMTEWGMDGRVLGADGVGSPLNPSTSSPYSVDTSKGTQSILKAISLLDTGSSCRTKNSDGVTRKCFQHVEVLTVLDSVPADAGTTVMRPAYFGDDKRLVSLDDVDWSVLPELTVPTRPSGLATIEDWDDALYAMEAVKPDWGYGYSAIESIAPLENYPGVTNGYNPNGQNLIWKNSFQVVYAASGADIAKRDLLRIRLLQHGLDLYGIVKYGDGNLHEYGGGWYPKGGYGTGRYAAVLYAAVLVDDNEDRVGHMNDKLSTVLKRQSFAETGQITFGVNQALYGASAAEGGHGSNPSSSNTVAADPAGLKDGAGSKCPSSYMAIAFPIMLSEASFIRTVPAMNAIAHPTFMQYVARMVDDGIVGSCNESTPTIGVCDAGQDLGHYCIQQDGECGSGGNCARAGTGFKSTSYTNRAAINAWHAFDSCYANSSCPGMNDDAPQQPPGPSGRPEAPSLFP